MEIGRLASDIKYVETNGVTMNVEDKARLDISCAELAKNSSDQIFFWGKIRGIVMDYFIVYKLVQKLPSQTLAAVQEAHLASKQFFWCSSSNFIFSSLPVVTDADLARTLSEMGALFSGEFDTVLIESKEPAKVIDAANGIVLPPKHVTELDRLAATVAEIDRACFSVPKGALKYTPLHQVVANEAFKGLSRDEAFTLQGWQHVRSPQNQEQKDLIARQEAVYSRDFLDEISDDKPNHCWTIISDTTRTVATIRSQVWPGYFGYHRCNTPLYGSVYVGDGIKNSELPFML